jgi:hypothetical protein
MFKRRRKDPKGFEAFPAVIVADQTNKLGKRLGQLAIGLLILFFVISSYIQAARNGKLLEGSDNDRRQLITSVERQSRTLDEQTSQILELQKAVAAQNEALREAGIAQVPVPGKPVYTSRPRAKTSPSPIARPAPTAVRPSATVSPRPKATVSPTPCTENPCCPPVPENAPVC